MTRRMLEETRKHWQKLSIYQRFEQIVVLALGLVVALVIIAAMFELLRMTFDLLWLRLLDPLRPEVFEAVFGMIMIVLIALEFNHTILGHMDRSFGIVQVRAVVLIALLAVLRKFLIVGITKADPLLLLALSLATLALGGVYWAIREQERAMRMDGHRQKAATESATGN